MKLKLIKRINKAILLTIGLSILYFSSSAIAVTCRTTVNCQTSGDYVKTAFGNPALYCNPSTGPNNCEFFNDSNECNGPNSTQQMLQVFWAFYNHNDVVACSTARTISK